MAITSPTAAQPISSLATGRDDTPPVPPGLRSSTSLGSGLRAGAALTDNIGRAAAELQDARAAAEEARDADRVEAELRSAETEEAQPADGENAPDALPGDRQAGPSDETGTARQIAEAQRAGESGAETERGTFVDLTV